MSWQRRERASKTKAAQSISTMITEQQLLPVGSSPDTEISPASDDSSPPKLSLKFTKEVWNAYTCPPGSTLEVTPPRSSKSKSKAGQKRKRKLAPITTGDRSVAKTQKCSPSARRQCKVRLNRFQYGGPDRREGGKYRDMISIETPCLQPTCANCWRWHPHLMCESVDVVGTKDSQPSRKRPRVDSVTEVLPAFLLPHTVLGNPFPRTPCLEPRSSVPALCHTVTALAFHSEAGRARFKALVHSQVKHGGQKPKPRRRYRVKLAFATGQGTERYERLVRGL